MRVFVLLLKTFINSYFYLLIRSRLASLFFKYFPASETATDWSPEFIEVSNFESWLNEEAVFSCAGASTRFTVGPFNSSKIWGLPEWIKDGAKISETPQSEGQYAAGSPLINYRVSSFYLIALSKIFLWIWIYLQVIKKDLLN